MPLLAATNALGTRVELAIDAPESPAIRAIADAAIEEVHFWHDRLSRHLPHSYLAHINRIASERPVPIDEDLFDLFTLIDRVCRASGGAFDPTLIGRWRDAVALDERRRTIHSTNAGVSLDLGGVAKGFALDRAADILREHSVESALLHAGTSTVVAIGDAPRRIGVRTSAGVDFITIADTSLSVSAQRNRSHIVARDIDASSERTSLVIGASCAETDAWSTAILADPHSIANIPSSLTAAIHDSRTWKSRAALPFVSPSEAA